MYDELRSRAKRVAETVECMMNYSLSLNSQNENIEDADDFKIINTFSVSPLSGYVPKMLRKEISDLVYIYLSYIDEELYKRNIVEKGNEYML